MTYLLSPGAVDLRRRTDQQPKTYSNYQELSCIGDTKIFGFYYTGLTFWLLHYVTGARLHFQQRRKLVLADVRLLQLGQLQISALCAARI
jgi:hypothetical protein